MNHYLKMYFFGLRHNMANIIKMSMDGYRREIEYNAWHGWRAQKIAELQAKRNNK